VSVKNSGVQLLIAEPGDNLPVPANASRLFRAYRSNETLATSLHVSNYGAADVPVGSSVRWRVLANFTAAGGRSTVRTVCQQNLTAGTAIKQGPGTQIVAEVSCLLPNLSQLTLSTDTLNRHSQVSCLLPNLGNLTHPSSINPGGAAVTLTVHAELLAGATPPVVNSWRSRLYPTEADGPSKVAVFTQPKFCVYLQNLSRTRTCHVQELPKFCGYTQNLSRTRTCHVQELPKFCGYTQNLSRTSSVCIYLSRTRSARFPSGQMRQSQ
jgi:hypothetical protein